MSGYSKFTNIKHKKERNDAAKGKIFTVIDREIAVTVKEDGADPANNGRLRDVIAKAKVNNMPNDITDRGIKKVASDTNFVGYETLTYEGCGSSGVAIIADTLTDDKSHTAVSVRSAFTKGGGSVDAPGSVSYMFDKKGQIIIDKEERGVDPDELMILALDAGTENFSEEEDSYEVVTAPEDFSAVREVPEAQSTPMIQANVTMIPQARMGLTNEDDIKKLSRTLDLLDEDDDVQTVYHN